VGGTERELRRRLTDAGLGEAADGLLGLAANSIRLRSEPGPAEATLTSPPAPVWGLDGGVVAIASGLGPNLALRSDGTVAAWGAAGTGDGTRKFRRAPVTVRDLDRVSAIAVGTHCLALREDGSVFAWGNNRYGQLGDGTRTERLAPVGVEGLEAGVVAIAAGDAMSLALMADGSVLGWGLSAADKLGIDDAPLTPVPVPGLERGIIAIAAGTYHRLALTGDGAVLAWGMRGIHALGFFGEDRLAGPIEAVGPATVEGLAAGVTSIAAGREHSLALTADGAGRAWGEGFFGALGDGTGKNRYPPVEPTALSDGVTAIAAGWGRSYAVKDSFAFAWGWNHEGMLGDGGTTNAEAPQPITALGDDVRAITPGLALKRDGAVFGWGGQYPVDELGLDARLVIGATKLAGRPDLPSRTRWPTRDGVVLSFLAQIDLSQVAPFDAARLLPSAGLLSFFVDETREQTEDAAWKVIHAAAGAPLERRAFPEELPDERRYRAVPLTAAVELTLPPNPPSWLSEDQQRVYRSDVLEDEAGPIHRMLGHPDAVQNDPRRDGDSVLLQVDSDEAAGMIWGDVGRLYYMLGAADLEAGRFDRVHGDFQSH